jgi:hypothetical protein
MSSVARTIFTPKALRFKRDLDTNDFVQTMNPNFCGKSVISLQQVQPFADVFRNNCYVFLDTDGKLCLVWSCYDESAKKLEDVLMRCQGGGSIEEYTGPSECYTVEIIIGPSIRIYKPFVYVLRGPTYSFEVCETCNKRAHNFEDEEVMTCVPPRHVLTFGPHQIDMNYREKLYALHPEFNTEEILGTWMDGCSDFPSMYAWTDCAEIDTDFDDDDDEDEC